MTVTHGPTDVYKCPNEVQTICMGSTSSMFSGEPSISLYCNSWLYSSQIQRHFAMFTSLWVALGQLAFVWCWIAITFDSNSNRQSMLFLAFHRELATLHLCIFSVRDNSFETMPFFLLSVLPFIVRFSFQSWTIIIIPFRDVFKQHGSRGNYKHSVVMLMSHFLLVVFELFCACGKEKICRRLLKNKTPIIITDRIHFRWRHGMFKKR